MQRVHGFCINKSAHYSKEGLFGELDSASSVIFKRIESLRAAFAANYRTQKEILMMP